jgi:hypothetical protein
MRFRLSLEPKRVGAEVHIVRKLKRASVFADAGCGEIGRVGKSGKDAAANDEGCRIKLAFNSIIETKSQAAVRARQGDDAVLDDVGVHVQSRGSMVCGGVPFEQAFHASSSSC